MLTTMLSRQSALDRLKAGKHQLFVTTNIYKQFNPVEAFLTRSIN